MSGLFTIVTHVRTSTRCKICENTYICSLLKSSLTLSSQFMLSCSLSLNVSMQTKDCELNGNGHMQHCIILFNPLSLSLLTSCCVILYLSMSTCKQQACVTFQAKVDVLSEAMSSPWGGKPLVEQMRNKHTCTEKTRSYFSDISFETL